MHFHPLQKAIKEKEFELVTIKNQKLENLCRALQEERKSLYDKVQGAGDKPDGKTSEPTEKEEPEVLPTPEVPKDDRPVQSTAASAATPTIETPLAKELAKLKSEQARLQEIAGSFTISHIIPTETDVSQSQGLSEGVQEPEENHIQESNGEHPQEAQEDGEQEQRDLEMQSVD